MNNNNEAVSAVIGVVLMVGVTVILAAVIAAFMFGMGNNIPAAPGFAGFSIERITNSDGTHVIDVQTLSISNDLTAIDIKINNEAVVGLTTAPLLEVGGKVQITEAMGVSASGTDTITILGKTTSGKTVMLYEAEA